MHEHGMSIPKDGGPAFLHDAGGPYKNMWSGISVRDYFAAYALQGMLASSPNVERLAVDPDVWAAKAYAFASSMLKAREA